MKISGSLRIVATVSALLSITLNSLLMFLVMTKSPKNMGAYKYLMIFISAFEVLYSSLDMFVVPIHYSYGSVSLVLIDASSHPLNPPSLLVLNSVYWAFFGASLAIFAIHFVYRYLVVSENDLIRSFNSGKIVFWLLIPISIGVIWALTGLFLCGPYPEFTEMVRFEINATFGKEIEEFVYLGNFLYETDKEGWASLHSDTFIALGIMFISVSCSFNTILFFGYKCYRLVVTLMEGSSSSASTRSSALQSQLFFALVLQTAIPFLLMHIPVTILFAFLFLGRGLGIYTHFVSMTIAFYPALDPIPNLIIITPYRNALIGLLKCRTQVNPSVSETL